MCLVRTRPYGKVLMGLPNLTTAPSGSKFSYHYLPLVHALHSSDSIHTTRVSCVLMRSL